MKYYTSNGVKIIECAPSEIRIVMVDKAKKNLNKSTYVNANFFTGVRENGTYFTLPVNHVVCDIEATNKTLLEYNNRRGKYNGSKYYYDSFCAQGGVPQFYNHPLTTFYIENGKPKIEDLSGLRTTMTYAVAGIPVMLGGKDVMWKTYVSKQGWTGGELYGTCHIFLGLKNGSNTIYLMQWTSTTGNLIYSAEGFKKFSAMGFTDVIKLDGGGSTIMKYQGSVKYAHSENRQINCIIEVFAQSTSSSGSSTGSAQESKTNPYAVPTRAVTKGMSGNNVRWMQFQLNKAGFTCAIDGSFGPKTASALIAYQTARGLDPDGSCGPATRAALLKE